MGAIDLVVQVELRPPVASGLQRIGRAGTAWGELSNGVVFPKTRASLAAAAVVARGITRRRQATRYPRIPSTSWPQQVVAMVLGFAPLTADPISRCAAARPHSRDLPRASVRGRAG